ncbi:hypothetical protein BCR33DRAFT_852362 [Rhizoclosmatium globosum]|uniref:Rho-GAP domain-containing protein n=1 Tax=Rhizoclosmatium globosum TaxID=329046 RepID=A0A1Y2C3B7_9FUNG|nr:hypothetical protein BCR33DRAFT_852362 [Rhizoclosmatium globosum]|eukprot:ORY41384.1 hypothetical protein BCR33DRAFT_852362 [Rhizoclosmatium globosum]
MPDEQKSIKSNNSSRSSLNGSMISLKFEESKRGVGVWEVKEGFVPSGFWDELDSIAVERNCPSREHLHTFAYFVLHLQRVAEQANTNMMTAKNLAICIFVTAKEGGEYIIRYADLIFGNVDLVGRETVACLPYSETTSVFPELEDDPVELPPWDQRLMISSLDLCGDGLKTLFPLQK